MEGIPCAAGKNVRESLVNIEHLNYARFEKDVVAIPTGAPPTLRDITRLFRLWLSKAGIHMPLSDLLKYSWRLFRFFASCDERVQEQYEEVSWWNYLKADDTSLAYRRYFANGSRIHNSSRPQQALRRPLRCPTGSTARLARPTF